MNNLLKLFFFVTCLCSTGCYASMTGKVVDAETGKPIEGAILLVEWLKGHGIGLTYQTSAKAVEVFSDKDGIVKIPGYFNPFVEGPFITIYKPGYVAWNNHWIFPGYKKREDFNWKDNYVFCLERFKEGYSYVKHHGFISSCIHDTLSAETKANFIKLYEDTELDKWRKE